MSDWTGPWVFFTLISLRGHGLKIQWDSEEICILEGTIGFIIVLSNIGN